MAKAPKATETKAVNPKDQVGTGKLPLSNIPPIATAYMSLGFLEGKLKYGAWNWRMTPVRASVYLDAHKRHMDKFMSGEYCDPVTKVPHLGSAMCCLAIIADAEKQGTLIDDRAPSAQATVTAIDELAQNVQHLHELFKDKDPQHFTIAEKADTEAQELPPLPPLDTWIKWEATEDSTCPVPKNSMLNIKTVRGREDRCMASELVWSDCTNNILEYSVISYGAD